MKKVTGILLLLALLFTVTAVLAEVSVETDRQKISIGESLTITVHAPEDTVSCTYILYQNGGKYFETKDATQFGGVWYARKPGDYTLRVKIRHADKSSESAETSFTVTKDTVDPLAAVALDADLLFNQKDGWWKGFPYGSGTLNKSGCAIFTLSHALARLGFTGDSILPQNLAQTYKYCHVQGGTSNSMLINNAARAYGFNTWDDTIENPAEIRLLLQSGSMFTFSIVIGHIALIDGISEDGTKVHITDSAPGATQERIKKASMYLLSEDDSWSVINDLSTVPGAVWYPETGTWSGMNYWLDLDYVAKRGVRLIQPPWLFLQIEDASVPVQPEKFGSVLTTVIAEGETRSVDTKDLAWPHDTDEPLLARITASKKIWLTDPDGNNLVRVSPGQMLPVVSADKSGYLVRCENLFCRVSTKNADAVPVRLTECPHGTVAINGKVSSSGKVSIRSTPDGKTLEQWRTGTVVAILDESGESYLVESNGKQGWILKKYILPETDEP